jgi:hypothetical protein
MANRRTHLRAVKTEEKSKEDYKDKIRRHKMTAVYRFVFVVAALLIMVGVVYVQYKNHVYTAYDLVDTQRFDRVTGSEIMPLGENILTYSHDGAHCTDSKGQVLWNQTFEMQDILTATCEDVIAFADYNGRAVYVLDSTKKICEITTTMPIRSIAVAGNGRVAVAVADTAITWIYIYNPDGKKAYEVKTTMGQSGYPVDFSLSPNGELLGLVCMYADAGVIKSQIAFHNFGAVGSNMSDYRVSADTYPDTLIPYIEFINGNTAIAVGEDRMLVYKGDQKPVLKTQYLIEDEIQGVYHNEEYIGIMLRSDQIDKQHKLDVYSANKDNKVGSVYFNLKYDDIFFTDEYLAIYNNRECLIQTYGGKSKFEGEFLTTADLLMPIGKGKSFKYILISGENINTIQLK